jgi:tetratricopeptide (TPR) repeat protein
MKTQSNFANKKRGMVRAFSALLIASCFYAAPAFAALTQEQINVYSQADEGQRVHFLIGRAKLSQHGLVTDLLQKFPLQGPHAANRTLYIEGLVLNAEGDLTGAVEKYRKVLASDPSLTMVRSDLAQTLVQLGEDDSAKHHLKLLESEAPTPEVANNIRSFVDKLDAKRPVRVNGYVSLAPTTNVNNGTSHTTLTSNNPLFKDGLLDISANKKQSGVGLAAGLSLGYNKRLGNDWEFVAAGNVDARLYADANYNGLSFGETAELRYHIDKGYMGFGAVADQSYDTNSFEPLYNRVNYYSFGPRISMLYALSQKDQINASAVYEWRNIPDANIFDSVNYRADANWSHTFNASLQTSLSMGYEKQTYGTGLEFRSYGTGFVGVSTYKELAWGLTLGTNLQGRYVRFDDLEPISNKLREDYRVTAAVNFTKRDLNIAGFAPSISYTYNRNFCNIETWDFDSHNIDFRLTKDF